MNIQKLKPMTKYKIEKCPELTKVILFNFAGKMITKSGPDMFRWVEILAIDDKYRDWDDKIVHLSDATHFVLWPKEWGL